MLNTFAPSASTPPSAKTKHWTISTDVMTRTAALGPSRTEHSTPPTMWPDVPPATGKFSIMAAKTKAPERPMSGTFRGGRCSRAWRRAAPERRGGQDRRGGSGPPVEKSVGNMHSILPFAALPQQAEV